MASDDMRWRPDLPEVDESLRPHYQVEVPLPASVRATPRQLPLGAPQDDPVAYLEEELERLFGRSSDPDRRGSRGAPRPHLMVNRPPETRYVPAEVRPPRGTAVGVERVEVWITMADGLVHIFEIDHPVDVEVNHEMEPEPDEYAIFSNPVRIMSRMMEEFRLRVRSPRSWRHRVATNRPPRP